MTQQSRTARCGPRKRWQRIAALRAAFAMPKHSVQRMPTCTRFFSGGGRSDIMNELERFLDQHRHLTRRFFLGLGVGSVAATASWPLIGRAAPASPELAKAIAEL